MTKQEYVLLVAERLRELAEDGGARGWGICEHMFQEFCMDGTWLDVFEEWPQADREADHYPVPGGHLSAHYVFDLALEAGTMWQGEYGEARRDLADFMADWLEEHVEELCA